MEQLKSRDALESVLRSLQEELTECKDAILDGQILDDDGFMRKGTAEQLQMARDDINSDEMELLKLKTEKADADTSIVNLGWDLQKPYYRDKLDTMLRELGLTADVFFISNEHYMVCKGVKPVKGGLLELARTGIPDLRRHVLEMTAVDEMATMQEYIAEVETFLRGVSVVVNPEHLKQNREVLLTIERVKGRISDLKHQKYFAALDEAIEENLERSIRRRMDTLATKAAGLAHEKVTWHPSTLKAFISHAGRWKTKKVGSQDWNRAFFAKFVKVILANWDAFETAEADAFTSLQTALSSEIRGVIADANKRGAEKRLGDKTGEFRALIEAKIEAADRFCDKAKREYAIKLGANKTEATKPGIGAQQSYIDTAMNDVYELCKLVIGKGYRRKVVDMLAEHVEAKGNRSPFMSVVFDLKNAIEGDANAQLDPLIEAVEGIFDDITGWLEGVFAEKAGETIAPAIRKKLAGYLPGALQTIRDVKSQLDKIVGEYGSMI